MLKEEKTLANKAHTRLPYITERHKLGRENLGGVWHPVLTGPPRVADEDTAIQF